MTGRAKGGMNTDPHATCDSQGRTLSLFITAVQASDNVGAQALLSILPKVGWLLGDRGYEADCVREALKDKGVLAYIPGRKQRKKRVKYDKRRCKQFKHIEGDQGLEARRNTLRQVPQGISDSIHPHGVSH